MLKILILASFLLAINLAHQNMPGGYRKLSQQEIRNFQSDQQLKKVERKARHQFQTKHKFKLGKLVELSTQVVAGVNYKMVFQTTQGRYEIIVFHQPWTETVLVTSTQYAEQIL